MSADNPGPPANQATPANPTTGVDPTLHLTRWTVTSGSNVRSRGAVVITANPEYYRDTAEILRHALQTRLPAVCQWSEMAAAGCLLSYGPNLTRMRERTAYYIARILEGAKPSDLPIEQPSQVEMVVNLKTARLLGIAVPQSLLVRAEHVIE